MIPFYRLLEVTVHSLLIFLPLLFLAIWPFRRHLRFSFWTSNILVLLVCILQITMSMLVVFFHFSANFMFLIRTLVYAVFYFTLVKTHPGIGPVAVHADFSDGPDVAVQICLHAGKLILP